MVRLMNQIVDLKLCGSILLTFSLILQFYSYFRDEVVKLICSAIKDPVQDLEAELEMKREESRTETSASVMHQIDQVLRRVVADLMKQAKGIIKCLLCHQSNSCFSSGLNSNVL